MNHVTAALLDLTNIVGGFLLAAALLRELPRVGPSVTRAAGAVARGAVVIGVLALTVGGYYLILHLTAGPHVFHFELIGIGVGVATLRDRLFPLSRATNPTDRVTAPAGAPDASGLPGTTGPAGTGPMGTSPMGAGAGDPGAGAGPGFPITGNELLLAIFGLIAVIAGLQGLLTADG